MKSTLETKNQSLTRDDGIKLLQEFRKGLNQRSRNFFNVAVASETCRSVTEKLRPYYEAFPDIKNKAGEIADDGKFSGLDEMFGEIDIYPESFEDLANVLETI